jgi:hypothetical protein
MAAGSNQRKASLLAGSKTRVAGVTGDQVVKATPGVLHRIDVSNTNAAVQTLTLKDGATAQIVIQVPTKTTLLLDFGVPFATSIVLTPGSVDIDAMVLWD